MAEQPIIIKKKKAGGGHGHHGGAWKVAYADFVTAMMAFFLVMWLMGSDEETKSSVSHYFNHPNTPWKAGKDPASTSVHPMGEQEGNGESVLNGMFGLWPEELVEKPQPFRDKMKTNRLVAEVIEQILEGKPYGMDVSPKFVKFSLPEQVLFQPGSAALTEKAFDQLDLLGAVFKKFQMYIKIEGHTDETPLTGGKYLNNWDLSMARALSVMDYLVNAHGIEEKYFTPVGAGSREPLDSGASLEEQRKNRRVEFTLTYDRKIE